ncbi:hypothetical protein M413DRAFT_11736 [Hebeloma cylindrosporum]|uniref:Uncharacterized protein n=1 Tax=Hebeloma cylindrosporum TaxID=76867 RepID=A0A0C3C7R4_HEBCY|nr:hypothetical protein M413DRAFT_11736 [Hebeloma cylindrosporum h7]
MSPTRATSSLPPPEADLPIIPAATPAVATLPIAANTAIVDPAPLASKDKDTSQDRVPAPYRPSYLDYDERRFLETIRGLEDKRMCDEGCINARKQLVKFHRSFKKNGVPIPTVLDQVALYFVDLDRWPDQCHTGLMKFLAEMDQQQAVLGSPTGLPQPSSAPAPTEVVASTDQQRAMLPAPASPPPAREALVPSEPQVSSVEPQQPLSNAAQPLGPPIAPVQPPAAPVQPPIAPVGRLTGAAQSTPLPAPVPKPFAIPPPAVAGPSKAPSFPPTTPAGPTTVTTRRPISNPPPPSPVHGWNLRRRADPKGKGKARYVEVSEAEEEDELESEEEMVIKQDPDWNSLDLDRPTPQPSRKRKPKAEPKSAERPRESQEGAHEPTSDKTGAQQ